MTEAEIQTAIMRDLGRGDTRVFRNTVGQGWTGTADKRRAGLVRMEEGDVLLHHARPVRFGLAPGSADVIGWHSVVITPDMVGQRVARLLSIEVKSETGRPAADQVLWADIVLRAGGLAGIARSVDQARLIAGLQPLVTA